VCLRDVCICDIRVASLPLFVLRGPSASGSLCRVIRSFQMFFVEGVHRLDRLRPLFVV